MDPFLQTILAAVISFIAITLLFSFAFLLCNHKPKPTSQTHPPHRPAFNSDHLSSITIDESASFDPSLQQISMDDLISATNHFDHKLIIGDGSFGYVYKAQLCNSHGGGGGGVTVAVKKLSHDAFHGLREFRAEMETLAKLRHPNLVKILGYCVSGHDRVLIYEFIEKGSLDQWLHDTCDINIDDDDDGDSLSSLLCWEVRVKIVKGVANGLAFLHGLDTPIVHRDIKASNVLLDNEFEAHIADFGLARRIEGAHSHVSTQAAGTMGYMPPEYREGFTAATMKADVYSFGVLMFEVVTGKRPNWPVMEDGHEMWMVEWVKKRISENKHLEVIDSSIPRERLRDDEISEFLKVADLCTSEKPKERPLMREVVDMLNPITHS